MLVEKSILRKDNFLGIFSAFSKPLLATIKEALEEHFPLSISQLKSIIQIVLITVASDDEAKEKAKSIEGMQISAFWLDLWCKHLVGVWRDRNIEYFTVSMSFDLHDKLFKFFKLLDKLFKFIILKMYNFFIFKN